MSSTFTFYSSKWFYFMCLNCLTQNSTWNVSTFSLSLNFRIFLCIIFSWSHLQLSISHQIISRSHFLAFQNRCLTSLFCHSLTSRSFSWDSVTRLQSVNITAQSESLQEFEYDWDYSHWSDIKKEIWAMNEQKHK